MQHWVFMLWCNIHIKLHSIVALMLWHLIQCQAEDLLYEKFCFDSNPTSFWRSGQTCNQHENGLVKQNPIESVLCHLCYIYLTPNKVPIANHVQQQSVHNELGILLIVPHIDARGHCLKNIALQMTAADEDCRSPAVRRNHQDIPQTRSLSPTSSSYDRVKWQTHPT